MWLKLMSTVKIILAFHMYRKSIDDLDFNNLIILHKKQLERFTFTINQTWFDATLV